MVRYKLKHVLLLALFTLTFADKNQEIAEQKLDESPKISDKIVLKKSESYTHRKDEPSFITKLASWVFPLGSSKEDKSDLLPAEGGFGGPAYLPPPHSPQKDCNPCNLEPWIPVPSHGRLESSIHFHPPSSHDNDFSSHISDISFNPPPPRSVHKLYGSPPQFKQKYPPSSYNLPNEADIVIPEYMLPPPIHFKIPSLIYGPPRDSYGSPPKLNYDSPNKPVYIPPPRSSYHSPKPPYGPPPKPDYGPPPSSNTNYGPPPGTNYGPLSPFGLPEILFSPPSGYGSRQKQHYDVPHKQNFGPPPSFEYGPPPNIEYGPSSKLEYGPPKPQYGGPKPEYGPPKSEYVPPKHEYGPPKHAYDTINTDYLKQSSGPFDKFNLQTTRLHPISDTFQGKSSHSTSGNPQIQFSSFNSNSFLEDHTIGSNSISVPSDSYGAPVTPDNLNYAASVDALPLSSGDTNSHLIERPIPLPNLSSHPLAPIYSSTNFNDGINSKSTSYIEGSTSNNVEIQKSVEVANYLASVEHPVNIIQSPILEVDVKEVENAEYQANQVAIDSNRDDFRKTYDSRNLQTKLQPIYSANDQQDWRGTHNIQSNIKLSENPIVVDDNYASASNINQTVTNSNYTLVKRTNDKRLSIPSFHNNLIISTKEDDKINTEIIKKLLVEQGILRNLNKQVVQIGRLPLNNTFSSAFTPSSVSMGDWQPSTSTSLSTSMVPPPQNVHSTWSEIAFTSTKKPLQIIVPYTNKKSISFGNDWSKRMKKPDKFAEAYTTLVPMYTPPMPTEQSFWTKFSDDLKIAESNKAAAGGFTKSSTAVYNIRDFLKKDQYKGDRLPYDVITLQKNIDNWTQQAFSNSPLLQEASTEHLKSIPNSFVAHDVTRNLDNDHQSAESSKSEVLSKDNDIETNLIVAADTVTPQLSSTPTTSTTRPTIIKKIKSSWDLATITVSPQTREKVYVVTPQSYSFFTTPATAWSMAPKVENGTVNNSTFASHKFTVYLEPQEKKGRDLKEAKPSVKVIYSEWPHLINSLQTTTSRPTSRHPLFGLIDAPSYTPPPNATVETLLGHSRVATVVTPSTISTLAREESKKG